MHHRGAPHLWCWRVLWACAWRSSIQTAPQPCCSISRQPSQARLVQEPLQLSLLLDPGCLDALSSRLSQSPLSRAALGTKMAPCGSHELLQSTRVRLNGHEKPKALSFQLSAGWHAFFCFVLFIFSLSDSTNSQPWPGFGTDTFSPHPFWPARPCQPVFFWVRVVCRRCRPSGILDGPRPPLLLLPCISSRLSLQHRCLSSRLDLLSDLRS